MSSATTAVMNTMTGMTGMNMPTTTGAGAKATGTPSMGGMSMGGGCKISMLWNWYTIDSCFIARSWRITSKGMFAGSCIGVILLVIALEFLRRAGKEYDRFIVAQHVKSLASTAAVAPSSSNSSDHGKATSSSSAAACAPLAPQSFRPSVLQQAIRALLHMLQFAVAYFVMLLAMYYNGYIIICIFIGSYLGYFIFGWETLIVSATGNGRMEENATVCCG